VRKSEREIADILATLARQEQHISLDVPYSEAMRTALGDLDAEEDDTDHRAARDYLTPYLPASRDEETPLTAEQAAQTYEACMQAGPRAECLQPLNGRLEQVLCDAALHLGTGSEGACWNPPFQMMALLSALSRP
jgi:hypothetical protein